jgi:hypothetical protein
MAGGRGRRPATGENTWVAGARHLGGQWGSMAAGAELYDREVEEAKGSCEEPEMDREGCEKESESFSCVTCGIGG